MSRTEILKIDPLNPKEADIQRAGQIIREGGLAIIPTETVYGIAANMQDKNAIERLHKLKNRPREKHFSLHIGKKEALGDFVSEIPPLAYKLMDKFWPGPLTLILPGKENDTLGVRLSADSVALKIISAADVPVVCPSANISGKPAPVNFAQAIQDFNGLVELAIDTGATCLGIESTVVDLTVKPLRILREGAIKKQEIEEIAHKKNVLFVCTGNSCRSPIAEALLKQILEKKKRSDIEVSSAGIMALSGLSATSPTLEILKREGLDASTHRARKVTAQMLQRTDLILVMEKAHEERIINLAPEVKFRVFLLKEFAKIDNVNLEVNDPIGKPIDFYEQIFQAIKEAVERIAQVI